eukprot:5878739-Heterocapsa_arctica.AAC.1
MIFATRDGLSLTTSSVSGTRLRSNRTPQGAEQTSMPGTRPSAFLSTQPRSSKTLIVRRSALAAD